MKNIIFCLLLLTPFCSLRAQSYNGASHQLLLTKFDVLYNKAFPAFDLEDDKGDTLNTIILKGKTLYIDFWFTQCPPCLKEIPYAKALKNFFAADTNVVFVNICIDVIEQKQAWKDMIREKDIGGINLFYARNKPQKVNLLRTYRVEDFPTYMLVSKAFKIIGHNAPRPSDKGLIEWVITQGQKSIKTSDAFRDWQNKSKEAIEFRRINFTNLQSR